MSTQSSDAPTTNHGIERGQHDAATIQEEMKSGNLKHAARLLHAEAHRGTATEQQAFWKAMLPQGTASSLPSGFEITTGSDGAMHVSEHGQKKDLYDAKAVQHKIDQDALIRNGEGPEAVFRRQGMSAAEAKTAADKLKQLTGKGDKAFKTGDSFELKDGSIEWKDRGSAGKTEFPSVTKDYSTQSDDGGSAYEQPKDLDSPAVEKPPAPPSGSEGDQGNQGTADSKDQQDAFQQLSTEGQKKELQHLFDDFAVFGAYGNTMDKHLLENIIKGDRAGTWGAASELDKAAARYLVSNFDKGVAAPQAQFLWHTFDSAIDSDSLSRWLTTDGITHD